MTVPDGQAAVDHYRDEYWNDLPAVLAYLCRLATGDPGLWWMDHLKRTFATPPRRRALVIGCGNGWVERDLWDRGVAERFDAFDASPRYLEEAEAKRGARRIHYFRSDFGSFRPEARYDLVVNVAALHHAQRLHRMFDTLRDALEPDGLLVNWDYVGPSRNQYAPAHVALMQAVNRSLPERLRTPHPLAPDLRTMLAGDPTEAVHSADIERAFGDRFETLERHPLNGGIAYQILWNNVREFRSGDAEAAAALSSLLALDEAMTAAGLVPPLFVYSIGRPRRRPAPRALLDRWLREPLRERVAGLTGGMYAQELMANGHRLERSRLAVTRLVRSAARAVGRGR